MIAMRALSDREWDSVSDYCIESTRSRKGIGGLGTALTPVVILRTRGGTEKVRNLVLTYDVVPP